MQTTDFAPSLIKPRPQNSHKGSFGTLEMYCGSKNMTGAAILAANSALRSGVGLLCLCLPKNVKRILQPILPEPIYGKSKKTTAIVVGCGLGKRSSIVKKLLKRNLPTLIDADSLTYLSHHMNILENRKNDNIILTPHPTELARLLSTTTEKIELNREKAASYFVKKYGCYLVLKGHHTIIATPTGTLYENHTGSSALAKGGSGDVLSGLIASLLAQGYSYEDSAVLGVYIHGKAADNLSEIYSESTVLPSDLCLEIGKML